MSSLPDVWIYTDGSCWNSHEKHPGGWAAVLIDPRDDYRAEISGSEFPTTNNRMEMMAVIKALEMLKQPTRVVVTSDSEYVLNPFRKNWIKGWIRRGWRTSSDMPVKNRDLWERLVELEMVHSISWVWVKGHAGQKENERCDVLAGIAMRSLI